jgi:CRP-like cAMP-binding protein
MRDERAATYARILTLKRAAFLRGLPTAELAVVAEHSGERFFPKDHYLLREGEPVSTVYFIVDGQVEVWRKGRKLSVRGPGEAIGSLTFLARDPHGIEARALTDVVAYELDSDALLEIFEEQFPILHYVLRGMARQCLALMAAADPALVAPLLPLAEPPDVSPEPDLVERLLVLRRTTAFSRASINALAELSQAMAHVSYPAKLGLWEVGEPSGSMLLVFGGTVRLTLAGGAEIDVGPGFPLGAMESFAERPRWFSAQTLTRLEALHADTEAVIDIFEDNPEMALSYVALVCGLILRVREGLALQATPPAVLSQGAPAGEDAGA